MPIGVPRQVATPFSAAAWMLRNARVDIARPIILGILNVTPDSFSDGGQYFTLDAALERAEELIGEGADMLDVGGESTRPEAARVAESEERDRVIPVVREIRRRFPHVLLSVDTTRAAVARAALDEGANAVNDVSGLRLDPAMGTTVAQLGAGLVIMHSRGSVEEMASFLHAKYSDDVVGDVCAELQQAVAKAFDAGIPPAAMVLDPGIGFAKRSEHSLAVMRGLDRLVAMGYPVMIGASRKRVIGELSGRGVARERVFGTVGAHVAALARGARLFRVHDVRPHREALDTAWRILS